MKKTILCYGDSNTWGYVPIVGNRYPRDKRYTGVLAQALGPNYEIIEEGLNGRTTVFTDLVQAQRCGIEHLEPILLSHLPLDYLVFMLGTNDTKSRFNASAEEIGMGMANLIVRAKQIFQVRNCKAEIILLAPVPIKITDNDFMLDKESERKTELLAPIYKDIARLHHCHFLDLAHVTSELGADGVHLSEKGHAEIGRALADFIKNLDSKKS